MKSSMPGKNTSASVENITPFGLWMLVAGKEYFLPFSEYPYFAKASVRSIHKVEFSHGFHLRWPDLDVDLTIDNLEHPERYPLRVRVWGGRTKRGTESVLSVRS